MITFRVGDLLSQPDLTHIVHQANLYHTFGSGIAKSIKDRFPRAYEADLRTSYGDTSKLGSWSISESPSVGEPSIINCYSQSGLSSTHRCTSYEALDKACASLCSYFAGMESPVRVGMPFKIGCGLGGGDWKVVEPILFKHFGQSPIELVICRLG